jgi:ribonucleoside-diphosphate reductase alpha chain
MISLFDKDDEEMLTCKFGKWYETNPQRGRANNSATLLRGEVTKEEFLSLWKKVEMSNSGEPGFYFTDNKELGTNPCCEISLNSFQFCNLVEINASDIKDQDDLMERTVAAAFIGTIQASYTDFHYLRPEWKKTTEKEALLGIGMTGIASGAVLSLDLESAAKEAIDANRLFSKLIGINSAARVTCVKPSGTSSLVLGTSSGVHTWHDEYYMRRIRIGKNEAIYTYLSLYHPEMIEEDQMNSAQVVLSVPVAAPAGAITRSSENAIKFLERVKSLHENWIKPGHVEGDNTHNVSATVTIKNNEWEEVGEWLWSNQNHYNGLSFLPENLGSYPQTPFETITKEQYDQAIASCHSLDVTKIIEIKDNTNLNDQQACGGGGCEI